ncbi:arginyl-tRNA--protein transferase 1-like isoform X3 [Limulus polyphemus]|uniref:Arginyl-tRNA--protein transferase 1 n=1 Tax=Limulus polyphemus TaxID=6850 RepID=A0ABM1SFI4_LIMPO|nr:arginyl-tRNA--protein transferase 1-like isoform X3 [Limulus polyphemus]
MSEYSVVEYFPGHEGHRCGYCKSETTNFSNGMWAHALTVQDYQNLIDRGWRRSGKYCYKPTMEITCCPNYTIRCDSEAIKLTTSQKKVLKKVYNFLAFGRKSIQSDIKSSNTLDDVKSTDEPISDFPDSELVSKIAERTEKDDRNRIVWNKNEGIASCSNFLESSHLKPADSLKRKDDTDNFHPNQGATKSEKQSYSKSEIPKPGQGPDPTKPLCKKAKVLRREKKQQKLRKKVKGEDHEMKDQNSVNESKSLEDFLKAPLPENPAHRLEVESKPNGPSCGYGSFHQQYWLDGKLIAVGVLDILVSCVSSVYFFYDPDYSFLSLGTYAALREIAFCRELHREAPGIRYYYMGFYIHSCPKMKYKGNYYPSFLLCPETYTWHPIEKCTPKLDISKYSRFEEDGTKEDTVGEVNYDEVLVLHKYKVMPYSLYRHIRVTADDDEVHQYARLVGKKCYSNILLYRS